MKNVKYVLCWVLIYNIQLVSAQKYAVAAIDKSLLENADAVIREYTVKYEVTDTSKAKETCHEVITILKKSAEQEATFVEFYDKFSKINDIKGKIYDGNGKVIKTFKNSDIYDQSAASDYSLYEDNRVKLCRPIASIYPYTVEFDWVETFSGIQNYPNWRPQPFYDLSVEHASFEIIVPNKFNVRFKKFNYNDPIVPIETEKGKTYLLKAEKLIAIESEPNRPSFRDVFPVVYAIPEYFKLDNYSCHNKDWKNLGKWILNLNDQPNPLTDKTKNDLEQIKSKASSKNDLIRQVYEYMQSKTRYVSIQVGIGGQRPFDASVVDKYGYGDCKALSNYTKTLLSYVGIESRYTLAYATKDVPDIITDDSFDQFNHVILCVPDKSDTVWLECTSQTTPYGFLGFHTDNRHVLLVTNEGGVIAKTPHYISEQNKLNRNAEIHIENNGNANGTIFTSYSGLQYDERNEVIYLAPDKQKDYLYEDIGIPSTINSYKFTERKDRIPVLDETINLDLTKYAVTMGTRLMLPLNPVNRASAISKAGKERKSKFRLRMAYLDSDTIKFHLPEGYSVEYLPESKELKSEFGEYKYTVVPSADKSTVNYIRSLRMNDGIYSPEQYKDYVKFWNEVSKMDNIKISLLRNH